MNNFNIKKYDKSLINSLKEAKIPEGEAKGIYNTVMFNSGIRFRMIVSIILTLFFALFTVVPPHKLPFFNEGNYIFTLYFVLLNVLLNKISFGGITLAVLILGTLNNIRQFVIRKSYLAAIKQGYPQFIGFTEQPKEEKTE